MALSGAVGVVRSLIRITATGNVQVWGPNPAGPLECPHRAHTIRAGAWDNIAPASAAASTDTRGEQHGWNMGARACAACTSAKGA